jgi:hypothetical protein
VPTGPRGRRRAERTGGSAYRHGACEWSSDARASQRSGECPVASLTGRRQIVKAGAGRFSSSSAASSTERGEPLGTSRDAVRHGARSERAPPGLSIAGSGTEAPRPREELPSRGRRLCGNFAGTTVLHALSCESRPDHRIAEATVIAAVDVESRSLLPPVLRTQNPVRLTTRSGSTPTSYRSVWDAPPG